MPSPFKATIWLALLLLLPGAGLFFLVPPDRAPARTPAQPTRRASTPRYTKLYEKLDMGKAYRRLRDRIPTGDGVVMGHVEGTADAYLPDWKDARFQHVTFVKRAGPAEVFGHTNSTASRIYGPGGLAPGVETVHAFPVRAWMTGQYLNVGEPEPPIQGKVDVFNHSWISNSKKGARRVLRRVDYAIDAHGTNMVVGVNNGRDTKVPYLLCSAYNVIAVGNAQGKSSGGYTRIEGKGRCKPGIVAPGGLTSFATPAVSACVARLLEGARELENRSDAAARPETLKAILFAGATKPEGWKPAEGKPLDEHLGVGVANFDHSIRILRADAQKPGRIDPEAGWDHRALKPKDKKSYTFSLDHPRALSVVLDWNRRIEDKQIKNPETDKPAWAYHPVRANLNLHLMRIDQTGDEKIIDRSVAELDNVEHIYRPHLPAGRYRVIVSRQDKIPPDPWAYALAWRTGPAR